jgi:hypothetical protein
MSGRSLPNTVEHTAIRIMLQLLLDYLLTGWYHSPGYQLSMTHAHCRIPVHSQEADPLHFLLERNQHLIVHLLASGTIQVNMVDSFVPHIEAEPNRILEIFRHHSVSVSEIQLDCIPVGHAIVCDHRPRLVTALHCLQETDLEEYNTKPEKFWPVVLDKRFRTLVGGAWPVRKIG